MILVHVKMVEEPESNELFADVGKAAEQKAVEDLVHVRIDEKDPEKFFLLGSSMSSTERIEVKEFLTSNIEVFAWTPYDMPAIDPSFICHQLNVHPTARSIIQRTRRSAVDVPERPGKNPILFIGLTTVRTLCHGS